jgi:hypothetical protein
MRGAAERFTRRPNGSTLSSRPPSRATQPAGATPAVFAARPAPREHVGRRAAPTQLPRTEGLQPRANLGRPACFSVKLGGRATLLPCSYVRSHSAFRRFDERWLDHVRSLVDVSDFTRVAIGAVEQPICDGIRSLV